jgi:hypothetical protein
MERGLPIHKILLQISFSSIFFPEQQCWKSYPELLRGVVMQNFLGDYVTPNPPLLAIINSQKILSA